MKTSPTLIVVATAIALILTAAPSFAAEVTLEEVTFIGGGTQASDEGMWASNALTGNTEAPVLVPEPSSAAMLLLGSGLCGMIRRRERSGN